MKHKKEIIEGQNPFETGLTTSYLRYDSLELFLNGLSTGLGNQSMRDEEKDRPQLAELGERAVKKIEEATEIVAKMWKVSEPRMKDEDKL